MIFTPSRRRTGLSRLVAPGLTLLTFACLLIGADEGAAQEKPKPQGTDSVYAGMVEIPAGAFKMGVDERWLKKAFLQSRKLIPPLLQGKKKDLWWGILLRETPEHSVETEAYAIDRYEVTNAQYLQFLDDDCKRVAFTDRKMNNIYQVATSIFGPNPTSWEMESIYWLNQKKLESMAAKVLAANEAMAKGALDLFNEDLPKPARKDKFADLPQRNRLGAWLRFKLPDGTALNTYSRLVPEHWPQARPAADELDHAVRYVSGVDADAFARWAGKHVPTEVEWEKAARGPKNTVYPWGDEWNPEDRQQKNWLIWNGATAPPKSPAGDRPVAVDICPLGQSGYGCFNMLGNVMEWTSSSPLKYPRSDAKFPHWGQKGARVLRGQSFGSGKAYKTKELEIRATSRILEGPDGAVDERNLYSVLGFRCAKYHTPARDALIHSMAFIRKAGLLPEAQELSDADAYGIEQTTYAAAGKEGEGKVFVKDHTRFVGVVPVRLLPYSTAKALVEASRKDDDVILAMAHWDSGISVEAEVPVTAEPVVVEPADDPEGEGESGEEEKPADKPDDKPDKPADQPADGPADVGEEVPAGPKFSTELVAGGELPAFIGLHKGRLALFRAELKGIVFYGYLPDDTTATLTKSKPKDFKRMAEFADGKARFKIAVSGKARSRDIFTFDVELRLKGNPAEGWSGTKE